MRIIRAIVAGERSSATLADSGRRACTD